MFAVILGGFCKHLPDQQSKCVPINSSFLEKEEKTRRVKNSIYHIYIQKDTEGLRLILTIFFQVTFH